MMDVRADGDESEANESPPPSANASLVQCCINNVDPARQARIEASDASVRMTSCLQRCGFCYEGPFLVVDGKFVAGDHLDTLDRLTGEER